jgi:hypothetical protein
MSLTSGMVFDGPCQFMNGEYSIRIRINNIDGQNFESDNEIWSANFENQMEVSKGNGAFTDMGDNKVQMAWRDEATQFEGVFDMNSNTLTGKFTQYQGAMNGTGADFVLNLKA